MQDNTTVVPQAQGTNGGGELLELAELLAAYAEKRPEIANRTREYTRYLLAPDGQEPQERQRFRRRDAAFALAPRPPVEWLIDTIVTPGDLALVYGAFGSKKTWTLLNLAVCVAAGKPWLEKGTKQARVLIVDEESGEDRLARRLGMALRGEFLGDGTPVEFFSMAGINLLKNPEDAILLQAEIENAGAGLVIIDALADIMAGGDENSVKDTQPVLLALKRIADATKAAIFVIHHSNKSGDYRGSSAIPGVADVVFSITSRAQSPNIDIQSEKVRDGEPFALAAVAHFSDEQFWLTPSVPGDNDPRNRPAGKGEKFVLLYLAANEDSPVTTIVGAADICAPATAKSAVYSLANKGLIYRTNPGEVGQGSEARYSLTEKGTATLEGLE